MHPPELNIERVTPIEAIVKGPAILHEWRERHRLPVPGREFMRAYKQKRWDGTWTPGRWCVADGDGWAFRCSTGMGLRAWHDILGVIPRLESAWLPFTMSALELFDTVAPSPEPLRDYQRDAIVAAITTGWGRIALATNAGKGAVIARVTGIINDGITEGEARILICCDELAVFDALRIELHKWAGISPKLIKAGRKDPPGPGVTLAMVPTLARRVKESVAWKAWMAEQVVVIMDEADKATAMTWRRILQYATNSRWRLGFSGSFPDDLYEDMQLSELMGPVIARAGNAALIALGVSEKPLIELHAFDARPALTSQRFRHPNWWDLTGAERRDWTYRHAVISNPERHQFVASLVRPHVPTAIVVNRLDHGEELQALFGDAAVFLHGAATEEERNAVLDRFQSGDLRILIVTKILDRGTNRLGHATDIIFASGEGSERQTLQRIGRGLRKHKGKIGLRLVDVIDRVTLPPREPGKRRTRLETAADFLHTAVRDRIELYGKEQFEMRAHA